MNNFKILIAGFSGSGKTSLLQAARDLAPSDWEEFSDLDQLILKSRGKGFRDLASLIEAHGWEKFRLWERQELEGWLKEDGKGVLALGGGTLSPLVWELFRSSRKIKFCYLESDFETCWQRLTQEGEEKRPLVLRGKAELMKVYSERLLVFEQIPWKLRNSEGAELKQLAREFWQEITF